MTPETSPTTELSIDSPKKKMGKSAKILLILGINLGLLLFTTEVILRIARPDQVSQEQLMPTFLKTQSGRRGMAHPYLAFIPRPDWQSPAESKNSTSHNSFGFRGPEISIEKPDDVFRIVCVGGSSTYGHTPSSDETTWPAQLQEMLNKGQDKKRVEVINGGFSGYNTFESLANFNFRLLPFDPDLVIVYHTINDARCTLYKNTAKHDNTHWRAVWPIYSPTPTEKLLESSMTYLIDRRYMTDYISGMGDMGQWGIVDYDPAETNVWKLGNTTKIGFQNFQRNLESLHASAAARDVQMVVASQGCDRTDFRGKNKVQFGAFDRNEKILRDVAADKNLLFVEGKAALDSAAAQEGVDTVYTHEVHLTDRGCEVLADAFARALLKSGSIQ